MPKTTKATKSRLVIASWRDLPESRREFMAETILFGRYGIDGYLRLAEYRLERRPDLAAKALRRAAELYAMLFLVGYRSEDAGSRVEVLAKKLDLPVVWPPGHWPSS